MASGVQTKDVGSGKQYIEFDNRVDVIKFVDIMLDAIASDMPLEIDFKGMKWCITYWGREVKLPTTEVVPDNRNEIIEKLTARNKFLEDERENRFIMGVL